MQLPQRVGGYVLVEIQRVPGLSLVNISRDLDMMELRDSVDSVFEHS